MVEGSFSGQEALTWRSDIPAVMYGYLRLLGRLSMFGTGVNVAARRTG